MDEMKNGSEMAKGKTTRACGAGCGCGCGCGGARGCMHRVIWWVVGIVILAFVFALGVRAGEFRDELRAAFGNSYYRSYPIMQGRGGYDGGVAVPMQGGGRASVTGTVGSVPIGTAPIGQ